jgi:arylsulfatase A-like enzyme
VFNFYLRLSVFMVCFAYCGAHGARAATKAPNIVFIYTDDHSQAAISAYGSTMNKTPNIDRLAAEGMRFTQSFVANSICGPARACILSGSHSHANGMIHNVAKFRQDIPTFAKEMQANGYQTAMVGKWHISGKPVGFDYYGITRDYYLASVDTKKGEIPLTGYTTEVITDLTLDWINKRDKEKPFVAWVCHSAVHRTWMPGPQYLTRYDDVMIPEPRTLFDDYKGRSPGATRAQMRISRDLFPAYDLKLPITGEGYLDRFARERQKHMTPENAAAWHAAYGPKNKAFADAKLSGKALTSWNFQRYAKDYLRCVDAVDDSVGKILSYLEKNDLDDNTIVIYSSDQGFFVGEHGWYDKRWMYDPSMRTPLIVRWPGVTDKGTLCDRLVQNIDMAPTMLDAAGLSVPKEMQGKSLVPLLKGEQPSDWRDAVYYHYQMDDGKQKSSHVVAKHYGVRTSRYKLMYVYEHDYWELYDMKHDPDEMTNRYRDPEYRSIAKKLTAKLAQLRTSYKDTTGPRVPPNLL